MELLFTKISSQLARRSTQNLFFTVLDTNIYGTKQLPSRYNFMTSLTISPYWNDLSYALWYIQGKVKPCETFVIKQVVTAYEFCIDFDELWEKLLSDSSWYWSNYFHKIFCRWHRYRVWIRQVCTPPIFFFFKNRGGVNI